jgi:CHAT domain-containing protein
MGGIRIDPTRGEIRLGRRNALNPIDIEADGAVVSLAEGFGRGGNITLNARENITTGALVSGSGQGDGGHIALTSTNGAIDTSQGEIRFDRETIPNEGLLLSGAGGEGTGGNITVTARGNILAGTVSTASLEGDAGEIQLASQTGDVEVFLLNSQSLDSGRGGNIDVNAAELFRATGTPSDLLNRLPADALLRLGPLPPGLDREASVSSSGGAGGGAIAIRHGGGIRTIPFAIGDAATNGTVGAITSGDFAIAPTQSFPGNFTLGNIRIITQTLDPCTLNPNCKSTTISAFSQSSTSLLSPVPIATLPEARDILLQVEQETGVKPAIIYVSFLPRAVVGEPSYEAREERLTEDFEQYLQLPEDKANPAITFEQGEDDPLELLVITAEGEKIYKRLPDVTRKQVLEEANALRRAAISPIANRYQAPAQQLYQWLIAPIEADLQARQIGTLAFIMETGLRSLPLAVLNDGEEYLIEKYSVGLMPSLSLTDTRYRDVRNAQVLAMGAEEFVELSPLLAVPLELRLIAEQLWQGEFFLNEEFTLENLKAARSDRPFGIIHLATHGEFRPGDPNNSYIQLWDTRLPLDQLRQLGWNDPPVELLVLSACRTALGDREAELGFAGLAAQAGVKSALGSLWYVSDRGTLALMTAFYQQLRQEPLKAQALQQAQLALLRGEVRFEGGQLIVGDCAYELSSELKDLPNQILTHPYYWGGFTAIGNPW